jgi:hypothetical protein
VIGILALDRAAEARARLPSDCRGDVCLNREKMNVTESFAGARRLALASDVLWVGGARAIAAGVTWLMIVKRCAKSASTEIRVRPGGVVLSSRF